MFEDKTKIDFVEIRERLVDEGNLVFNFDIRNSKNSYNVSLSKLHPEISILMLPLGVGIAREWIDLYNKNLNSKGNVLLDSDKKQDIVIRTDESLGQRITDVVGENYHENFFVDWGSRFNDYVEQISAIRQGTNLFTNKQKLFQNDKNISEVLEPIYEEVTNSQNSKPDEIYHKVFSGFGDYFKDLINSEVLTSDELKSFSGEMVELGYKSLGEDMPNKFIKFGFTKTFERTIFFEIIEGKTTEFKKIEFEGENYTIMSKYDKIINIYE